jgi:redox-sensing transcriptional repressor
MSDISEATINRLPLYLRELEQLQRIGTARVQSGQIAKRLGFSDSQVRRDLSVLGSMGQRGVGYDVRSLIGTIRNQLGGDRSWNVVLVGVGNLGKALCGYRGFDQHGLNLVGVFDVDPAKIGTKLGDHVIRPLGELESLVEEQTVELAILAVPASVAPAVAQRLEVVGISGILNFAPVNVKQKLSSLTIVDVDLAIELQRLAHAVLRARSEKSED